MQQTPINKDTGCHHYTRRDFIKAMGLGTAGFALGTSSSPAGNPAAGTARRPNLLFILTDQLGYQRCGYAGDKKARTPNIDKLASQAANFQNAVSNMPVCSAYRASLFTGKYTTSTGMVINELRMRTDHESFGRVLTRSSYQTAYIGKWHLYANQLGHHYESKNSFVPPGPNRPGSATILSWYSLRITAKCSALMDDAQRTYFMMKPLASRY